MGNTMAKTLSGEGLVTRDGQVIGIASYELVMTESEDTYSAATFAPNRQEITTQGVEIEGTVELEDQNVQRDLFFKTADLVLRLEDDDRSVPFHYVDEYGAIRWKGT